MLSFFAGKTPKAILLQIEFYREDSPDFDELKELALTAGVSIMGTLEARKDRPDPKFCIGGGKVDELAEAIRLRGATLAIFNHDLTPTQERNLTERLSCQVMSRTALILEIFSQRARTHEGKLQVELAHLGYQATRLVRGWTHLERQRGGIGVRGGPGETQLELDKRLLRGRMKSLKMELEKVKSQRHLGRASREKSNTPCVALVGYTNAGKSTLFNRLAHAEVYAANKLFATLDPTLRQITLPHYGDVVLADTVGFIRHLPHSLVDAFRATLEEVTEADLLLHVIDASHPDYAIQREQVLKVLEEIGASDRPILEVMNKIDRCVLAPKPHTVSNEKGLPTQVWLSALNDEGLPLLETAILSHLSESLFEGVLTLPPTRGDIRSTLYEWGAVQKEEVDEEGCFHLTLSVSQLRLDVLRTK